MSKDTATEEVGLKSKLIGLFAGALAYGIEINECQNCGVMFSGLSLKDGSKRCLHCGYTEKPS